MKINLNVELIFLYSIITAVDNMSELEMKCKIVTFEDVHDMVGKVAEKVKQSGYKPDVIIGLARGGWLPARLMCDFLAVTDLLSLKVEHWIQTGRTKDEATVKYPLLADLSGKKILVVDDIADTGKSLITAIKHLTECNKPKKLKTATMQYMSESKFKPDYYSEEVTVWTWFIYPWNWIEDTSTLIIKMMTKNEDAKKKWDLKKIRETLKKRFDIEWNEQMLSNILKNMLDRGQIGIMDKPTGTIYVL